MLEVCNAVDAHIIELQRASDFIINNKVFIFEVDSIQQRCFEDEQRAIYFPQYTLKRKKIMTTLLSGDVQDALYSIFTCNGD